MPFNDSSCAGDRKALAEIPTTFRDLVTLKLGQVVWLSEIKCSFAPVDVFGLNTLRQCRRQTMVVGVEYWHSSAEHSVRDSPRCDMR